jgi:hypothetical protein
MTHTYRDPEARGQRPLAGLLLTLLVIPLLILPAVVRGGFSSGDALILAVVTILGLLVAGAVYRNQSFGVCSEIRLDDDGTCELETKRRVLRLHVHEIYAVRYHPETDESSESYEIRCKDGKLHVERTMTDFLDFVRRLKMLNPGVDLIRFPADAGFALERTDRAGIDVGRFIRSAFFPAVVVLLLIWVAVQNGH